MSSELLVALSEPLSQRHGIAVDFDLTNQPIDLPAHARSELLQVAREALANIARHARAADVRISLATGDGLVRLTIEDDGVGFDAAGPSPIGHFGLVNMRDRVDSARRHASTSWPGSGRARVSS